MEVKLENWSSGIFVLGVIPSASQTINNTGFTADYTLGTVANTDLYWVTTKISWTEPVL